MSAAAAGQGVAGGAAAGDAGGEAAQGAAQGFDAGQLEAMAGGLNELRQQFGQFVESAPWQPQEAAQETAPAEIDLSFLDEAYSNPGFGEAERAAQQQQFAAALQQHAQQAVAPVQEKLAEIQREQAMRDLVATYPQFQDEAHAQRIAGPNGLARQVAEALGQPELAQNPLLWKLVHEADAAAAAANKEEGGESPSAAHLEGGGGAGPGGGGEADIAGQILGAKRGNSVLPY